MPRPGTHWLASKQSPQERRAPARSAFHHLRAILRPSPFRKAARTEARPPGIVQADLNPSDDRQWLKLSAESRCGWHGEPVLKNRRVDAPKVDARFQVAPVEIEQARCCAHEPAAHVLARKEYGAGGTVIRAGRAVLGDPAPELAKAHHQHAVRQARRFQFVLEALERIRELEEQVRLARKLVGVRIVAALKGVIDTRFAQISRGRR